MNPLHITIGFLIAAVLAMGIYLIADHTSRKNSIEQAIDAERYSTMNAKQLNEAAKRGDAMAQHEIERKSRETRQALQDNAKMQKMYSR